MLSELSIENYILIPRLEIQFQAGFNAITGETGAGKSILLGALSLILGQRAESQSLLDPSKKCIIEGVFEKPSETIDNFLSEHDLDHADKLIIRREIAPGGKSRAFINDTPVQLWQFKALGDLLVDVHSQHSTLYLNESGFQLDVIDHYAGNEQIRNEFRQGYTDYISLEKQRDQLAEADRKQSTEVDFLQFQLDELTAARLIDGEKQQLESELESLIHAEEIKIKLYQASKGLNQSDEATVGQLRSIHTILRQASALSSEVAEHESRLDACIIELDDLGDELTALAEKITHDPERIQVVQERLDLIYRLEHKHHIHASTNLCEIRDALTARLNAFQSVAENLLNAERALASSKNRLNELAQQLSESRKQVFGPFVHEVLGHLESIGMSKARLEVEHQSLEQPNEHGIDRIEFLFNANPDGALRPIAKVASGGELSRLMLAVKAALSAKSMVATIIFDEIDTGVSGDIATRLGSMMRQMSNGAQLIAITHLPQIAAKATTHFKVSKINTSMGTRTNINQLDKDQRIEELAGMLSGASPSDEARTTAKQLML